MLEAIRILTPAVMLGTGIIAGVFFAFSVFIMPALSRISPGAAVAAMRSINRVILRTIFIPVFIGNLLAGVALVVLAWFATPVSWALIAAGLAYAAGCFGVTMIGNVPLNNRLETAGDGASEEFWRDYERRWTRLNHVRTIASAAACLLYGLSR